MKLVWCPDTAGKAYIDTVKILGNSGSGGGVGVAGDQAETDVAELVAAMAGGWRAQCIVEAWSPRGDGVATSVGLAAAAKRTGGRHVCVVPDERVRAEYAEAMGGTEVELLAGEAEEVMGGISGVDFVVVDWRRRDVGRVLRSARFGPRGAVLVCKEAGQRSGSGDGGGGGGRWRGVLMAGTRVVRSTLLPIGTGVEIVHVGVGKGPSLGDHSRWIKHIDRQTGEEHLFRR